MLRSKIFYSTLKGILPVQIVDGVAPVVLCVPAKTGETHAHVAPRNLNKKPHTLIKKSRFTCPRSTKESKQKATHSQQKQSILSQFPS